MQKKVQTCCVWIIGLTLATNSSFAIDVKDVTFASSLGPQKEAVGPTKSFPPDATVYLSVRVAGQPKTGKLTCRFFYRTHRVAEASVDFAKQNKGLLFSFGSSTNVGFHLSHDQPFPVSSHFRAELLVDGKSIGSHPFRVVAPKGAMKAKLISAELAKDVDERFRPIRKAKEFSPREKVFLSVVADVGEQTWVQGVWFVDGKPIDASIRSLTFEENRKDTGMAFSFLPEGGWPLGRHEVALIMNDDEVAREKFTIVKPSADRPKTADNGKPEPRPMRRSAEDKDDQPTPVPENPKTAAEFNTRGEHFYEQDQLDDALADFNKAIRMEPKNAEYMSNRGWTYYALDDADTAIVDFDDAILIDPKLTEAYRGRAQIHTDREDWAAAVRDLSRAIRSADDDAFAAELYAERGCVKYFSGDVDEALRDFERAVQRDPQFAWGYANRGEVLSDVGQFEAAISAFRKAIETDAEELVFYEFLGAACEEAGLFDEAVAAYTDALLVELDNVAWYHRRANAYQQNGDLTSAVRDLRKAIKVDPGNADSYNDLALLYRGAEEYDAAFKEFSSALEVDGSNAVVWYNRAELLWQMDELERALADINESLKLDDGDADSYFLRASILEASGEFKPAAQDYRRAVGIAPGVYRMETERYLRVANSTDEDLTLYLQYFDGTWTPEDRSVATFFTIPAGADLTLDHNDKTVRGSRFRVWAVGKESDREYPAYRDRDFVAAPEGGYATASGDRESITITFPVEPETGDSTSTTEPSPAEKSPGMTKRPVVEALPRSRTVHAVAFGSNDDGDAFGVCFPVKITVEKNPEHRIDLAFTLGQSGSSWKSAGWMATCLAADILGHNPLSTQVNFSTKTNIDGPSGGGLMTVGVMAALRGDPVRQEIAMTGTINPDGTIGTVGGIAQKMEGAAAVGKKMFLFPVGHRFGTDAKTKQQVDLIAHGRKLGLDARPVGDVYSAYEIITGVSLPRPKAAAAPQLDPAMYSRVRGMVDRRVQQFRRDETMLKSLPSGYRPAEVMELLKEGRTRLPAISRLLSDGLAPVAFKDASDASQSSAVAVTVASVLKTMDQRGVEAGRTFVRQLNAETSRKKAMAELQGIHPTTLSGASVLMQGYATLLQGMACQDIADQLLAGTLRLRPAESQMEQQLINTVQACVFTRIAMSSYENMSEVLEIAGNVGGRPIPNGAPFESTTLFLKEAAMANLTQFEVIIVKGYAKAHGVKVADMKTALMNQDKKYMITRFANDTALPKLLSELKDSEAQVYAHLGGALQLYVMASRLQTEYYSLQVKRDDEGNAVSVGSEASLKYMLDFSEDQVRRSIQLLRDHDVEPMASVFFCQMGSGLRGRGLEEQLGALTAFWQASVQARTLAYLGGFSVPDQQ